MGEFCPENTSLWPKKVASYSKKSQTCKRHIKLDSKLFKNQKIDLKKLKKTNSTDLSSKYGTLQQNKISFIFSLI